MKNFGWSGEHFTLFLIRYNLNSKATDILSNAFPLINSKLGTVLDLCYKHRTFHKQSTVNTSSEPATKWTVYEEIIEETEADESLSILSPDFHKENPTDIWDHAIYIKSSRSSLFLAHWCSISKFGKNGTKKFQFQNDAAAGLSRFSKLVFTE